ncbi:MAG TPA: DUF559 domain-containing protein [Acidimicrobiales bacterium]|jgi:hypothetical protein|nr:DUF559 domain-containing protein [Acidimicrobiales bacterium]
MAILGNPTVAEHLTLQSQAISRRQLLAAGVKVHQVEYAIGLEIEPAEPGVYVQRGSTDTWERRLWVRRLRLGPIASISREAAAAVQTFHSFPRGAVSFVVPHATNPKVEGVHQSGGAWLDAEERYANLPVTAPVQTLCDLAATTRRGRLREVIDDAFARRLVTPLDLVDHYDRTRARGKPGYAMLGEILDDWRDRGKIPTRSVLERKTLDLFDRFGGPKPVVGWAYPSRTELPHIADFADREALLVLETDGRRWHDRIQQKKRDVERDANAARHGIQVLRVLWEHVTGDPRGTWELYMETRRVRLQQFGRAA